MAAALLETPSRLLKRVQQLEDMTMPSLPSFQHDDIDYDSMSGAESSRDDLHRYQEQQSQDQSFDDMATPHPLRKATGPPPSTTVTATTRSSADSFSTASGSPFPPLAPSNEHGTPSPYAPATALTSTPHSRYSRSQSRSLAHSTNDNTTTTTTTGTSKLTHERTRSGTGSIGDSTRTRRERWQTPGEMSGSFSGEEIPDQMELGTEKSVPLNDHSELYDDSQILPELPSLIDASPPEETPITRRMSSGHVLFERPRRRGPSAANHLLPALEEGLSGPSTPATSIAPSTPINAAAPPPPSSSATAIHILQQDRIPSLSRSEVSATETSGAATTPEGPVRNVSMMTPRSDAPHEYEITGEYQYESENEHHDQSGGPTLEYHHEYEYEASEQDRDASVVQHDFASPVKIYESMSLPKDVTSPFTARLSTPGMNRGVSRSTDSYTSTGHPTPSQNATALQDVTDSVQNTPYTPYTPSPIGITSKLSDVSTPRAPLDDAQRRKSHVLAVLNSSGSASRISRPSVKGTPHPLRRVSAAPASESIAEEGSDIISPQPSRAMTPGMASRLTVDESGNESFVSIASSADLTSDRRASHMHSRLSRGNTSFPTILLPTNGPSTSAGGSLKGLSDQRADGIKIHKHLNAMNKQLLETNADLAREAEAWRDEVDRLRGALQEAGIEVEEIDVLAGIHAERSGVISNSRQQYRDLSADSDPSMANLLAQVARPYGENKTNSSALELLQGMSPEEHAAVMQEMAERIESLEGGVEEKDRLIAELEYQIKSSGRSSPDENQLRAQIDELQAQVDKAEQARAGLHTEFAQKTEQHAKRFGDICSGFEEQVKGLEQEVATAKAEINRLHADKERLESLTLSQSASAREQELRKQVQSLEHDLSEAREQIQTSEREAQSLEQHVAHLESERAELVRKVENSQDQVLALEERGKQASTREDQTKADIEAMKGELRAACVGQKEAEDEAGRLKEDLADLRQANADQEAELDRQHEQIDDLHRAMEDLQADLASFQRSPVVEGSGEEMRRLQQELEDVNDALADREAEIEALRGKLENAELASNALRRSARRSVSPSSTLTPAAKTSGVSDMSAKEQDSFVAAMEERLDEAYREIGRLKHELAATPHRKTALEIKDARIQALEREKAVLADRLAATKSVSATPAPSMSNGMIHAESPFKTRTPLVHKTIASLKTPGPMPELSWLQTTMGDSNLPILQAQMEYLQTELDNANNQLDHNFSRLEAAGHGAVTLAEKLAAAEDRIGDLEDEIRTLVQRNKASLVLVSAQREERERDNEGRMEKALHAVHLQMEDHKMDIATERARLQKDNGRLNDLVSEMKLKSHAEVESFRAEMQRISVESQEDLRSAQDELSRAIRERDDLRDELRVSKANASRLERKLSEEQRAHDSLTRRAAQSAQNGPAQAKAQVELDEKRQTIRSLEATLREASSSSDRLRVELKRRNEELEDAKFKVEQYRSEREGIIRELSEFEEDLRTQRAESEEFGRQLQLLRREQDSGNGKHARELASLERELRETREKLKISTRQLNDAQTKYTELERWQGSHQCSTISSEVLSDQKARFKASSRELATQIRYLKAKYTRESTFRNALALQKRYLLLLVGGMSLNEQATLREISRMGFPIPESPRPKRTFKAVSLAVMGVIRAKNAAKNWRNELSIKSSAVVASHERRRVSSRT